MSSPLCALVVGHSKGSPGAISIGGVSEWDFNDELARAIVQRICPSTCQVELLYRDEGGYTQLPRQINEVAPDFAVELHFNSVSNQRASGTEMLHWHSSRLGEQFAGLLQAEILRALDLPDRGLLRRGFGDRGGYLLGHTVAPIVIAEPFFGSSPHDWRSAVARKTQLVEAYAQAIEKYAQVIN